MKIINLLPKTRQQELHYEVILHTLWVVVSLSLVSFVLVFLAQFGTKFYLQYEDNAIKQQVAQLQSQVDKQQNTEIKAKISAVNNLVSDYLNLAGSSPHWSKVIKAFAPLPPSGLKISTLSIDPNQDAVTITGLSPTRDLVILLYNNILNDTGDFYGIDYPLENVVNPVNVNFHFTFKIQNKLLQQ
jgi:Tfp pilus assembly protein PilN